MFNRVREIRMKELEARPSANFSRRFCAVFKGGTVVDTDKFNEMVNLLVETEGCAKVFDDQFEAMKSQLNKTETKLTETQAELAATKLEMKALTTRVESIEAHFKPPAERRYRYDVRSVSKTDPDEGIDSDIDVESAGQLARHRVPSRLQQAKSSLECRRPAFATKLY